MWYGFEFGEEIKEILSRMKDIEVWLNTTKHMKEHKMPSWVYIDTGPKKEKVDILDLPEIITWGRAGKLDGDLAFGFSMYNSYRYCKNGIWGNGWLRVTEEDMIANLRQSLDQHNKMREKYEIAVHTLSAHGNHSNPTHAGTSGLVQVLDGPSAAGATVYHDYHGTYGGAA